MVVIGRQHMNMNTYLYIRTYIWMQILISV